MRLEIPKTNDLAQRVFTISNEKEFTSIALEVFQFQFSFNPVFHDYCLAVGRTPENVHRVIDIPFLPIGFFKSHRVATTAFVPDLVFKSSGTTGKTTSTHYVKDAKLYQKSFEQAFEMFYGPPEAFCVLGLLPSYLDQGHSSLVYMVDHLIRRSGHPHSGFYLHEFEKLDQTLRQLEASGKKTILIGVTYALLEFAARFPQHLKHTIIMETGGMKGRGRELVKNEMYAILKDAFKTDIHAEYGMTELLSQAYAVEGQYKTPPWMKLLIRDETDPFMIYPDGQGISGGISVIDLANLYSCSFIATEDVATKGKNGLEILGRMDHTDIRGCSLMAV